MMPDQMCHQMMAPIFYDARYNVERRIQLLKDEIYFVHFIRTDWELNLPNESFQVDSNLKDSYVVAQLSVNNHCLHLLNNNHALQTMEYSMPWADSLLVTL